MGFPKQKLELYAFKLKIAIVYSGQTFWKKQTCAWNRVVYYFCVWACCKMQAKPQCYLDGIGPFLTFINHGSCSLCPNAICDKRSILIRMGQFQKDLKHKLLWYVSFYTHLV